MRSIGSRCPSRNRWRHQESLAYQGEGVHLDHEALREDKETEGSLGNLGILVSRVSLDAFRSVRQTPHLMCGHFSTILHCSNF